MNRLPKRSLWSNTNQLMNKLVDPLKVAHLLASRRGFDDDLVLFSLFKGGTEFEQLRFLVFLHLTHFVGIRMLTQTKLTFRTELT